MQYWLVLITYAALIPLVHLMKSRMTFKNQDTKTIIVILISFIISSILNLLPAFAYTAFFSLDFITAEIGLTILCTALCGFIVVIMDALIKAKIQDVLIEFLKNFIKNKGEKS